MVNETSEVFSEPLMLYSRMLKDIEKAKKYIYLETYIYDADGIGIRFREALTAKAKKGVEVRVLADAWGSSVTDTFFAPLVAAGGHIRLFRKVTFEPKSFLHNHKRDHRKFLIIDDKIIYVGSANITADCLNWRELQVRLESSIAVSAKKVFNDNYQMHRLFKHHKGRRRTYKQDGYELISDTASIFSQRIRKKHLDFIKSAKKEILIETPYFVPDRQIRKALNKAALRGLDVCVVLPLVSDVRLVDVVRNVYLGQLHKNGVKIFYYRPRISHSKAMIVDGTDYIVGSANIDYRSFLYQYEVGIAGSGGRLSELLHEHIMQSIGDSDAFDYEHWKNRPFLQKIIERIIMLFKKLI